MVLSLNMIIGITEAVGCKDNPSLCDPTGGICLYNGLCVCKDHYMGATCN